MTLVAFSKLFLDDTSVVLAEFWVMLFVNDVVPDLKKLSLITLCAFVFLLFVTLPTPALVWFGDEKVETEEEEEEEKHLADVIGLLATNNLLIFCCLMLRPLHRLLVVANSMRFYSKNWRHE